MSSFTKEWIWDSDDETEVYAQGYGAGLTVSFRFTQHQDEDDQSLANRIVSYYHHVKSDESSDESEISSAPDQTDDPVQNRGMVRSEDAACGTTATPTVTGFADMEEMRKELWSVIEEVWPDVMKSSHAATLDTVFDLDATDGKRVSWKAEQHPGSPWSFDICKKAQVSLCILVLPLH